MDNEKRYQVYNRIEAARFLKTKGSKVALQVGFDGCYIYAEKSDFIENVLRGPRAKEFKTFTDYDGNPQSAFLENGVLHIPIGVS